MISPESSPSLGQTFPYVDLAVKQTGSYWKGEGQQSSQPNLHSLRLAAQRESTHWLVPSTKVVGLAQSQADGWSANPEPVTVAGERGGGQGCFGWPGLS